MDTEPDLLFSAGSVNITPTCAVPLAGFSDRSGPCLGVGDELEASAVLLRQGTTRVVILSLDLLYVGKRVREELLSRLRGRVHVEDVFICATHTHFAPATDNSKPLLGLVDETYMTFLVDQLQRLLNAVLDSDPLPGRLAYGTTKADHSVNRRLFRRIGLQNRLLRPNVTMLAPDPKGPTDETIRVLRIDKHSGEVACVLWNYCCHPVGNPQRNHVSADYPGAVRAALRERFGGQVPILFLQGFSGDVRPRDTQPPCGLKGRVRWTVLGPFFSGFSGKQWRQWTHALSGLVVEAATRSLQILPVAGGISSKRVEIPLARFLVKAPDSRGVTCHCLALGGRLRVIGVSAEPVVEYTDFLEHLPPGRIVIPVGCIDDVFGYLPTKEMIRRGGYEACGFLEFFSLSSPWSADFESQCRDAIESLVTSWRGD